MLGKKTLQIFFLFFLLMFDYELLIRLLTKHLTEIDYNILMAYVTIGKSLAGNKGPAEGHFGRFKMMGEHLVNSRRIS